MLKNSITFSKNIEIAENNDITEKIIDKNYTYLTDTALEDASYELYTEIKNKCGDKVLLIDKGTTACTDPGSSAIISLKNVEIAFLPNSVKRINAYAFRCMNMKSIVLPNSITTIEDNAFRVNNYLSVIVFLGTEEEFNKIEKNNYEWLTTSGVNVSDEITTRVGGVEIFCNDTSIYLDKLSYTLYNENYAVINAGTLFEKYFIIPDTYKSTPVIRIDDSAFLGNNVLHRIEIPNSITEIGSHAFADCTNLTSIHKMYRVTSIGDFAFSRTALRSIEIPAGARLGDNVFSYCESLNTIIFNWGGTSYTNLTILNDNALKNIKNTPAIKVYGLADNSYAYTNLKYFVEQNIIALRGGGIKSVTGHTSQGYQLSTCSVW